MQFGIHLPNFSPLTGREPTIRVATQAEALGFDSLWVSDHIVLRDRLLTAKMLSSLDMLAGGRVVLAVGTGWMKEEFEALNLPYFAQRGKVTDEWIDIFRTCWREPLPRYQ